MAIDRRFKVVLLICLAWALLVSLVFYRMVLSGGSKGLGSQEKPLVVATGPLGLGSVIRPEHVKIIKVPAAAFPKGAFGAMEEVLDRAVTSPILIDEPLLPGRLAERGAGAGLPSLIPPGKRAMAIRVNDVVAVAGFVLPGMRVDVLVTGRPPGGVDTLTKTVLQNIAVLSAGQTIQTDGKSQTINAQVVTLLVTPDQAEVLTLALNDGRIQLSLRNASDAGETPTAGGRLSTLYGAQPVTPPPPTEPVPVRASRPVPARVEPKPPVTRAPDDQATDSQVTVIRGAQKSQESVRVAGGS